MRCMQAVIGAGAAGLVAARELLREGHKVTVFEQGSRVGGVWVYTEEIEKDDLLGRDPNRLKVCRLFWQAAALSNAARASLGHQVHSSMYSGLRTNLPREIMSYLDFPFTPELMGKSRSVDPRRFCSHVEVGQGGFLVHARFCGFGPDDSLFLFQGPQILGSILRLL